MTREEAIELKAAVGRLMYSDNKDIRDYNALIDFIESALRPVSRERVEKAWRGEWTGNFNAHCGLCDAFSTMAYIGQGGNFCPACGAAQTDEAVEMVMDRLEALKDAVD